MALKMSWMPTLEVIESMSKVSLKICFEATFHSSGPRMLGRDGSGGKGHVGGLGETFLSMGQKSLLPRWLLHVLELSR
jgi:hypothetical protein